MNPGFSLRRSNFFDFTSFAHSFQSIVKVSASSNKTQLNQITVIPKQPVAGVNKTSSLKEITSGLNLVKIKNEDRVIFHHSPLKQVNGYSPITFSDKIKPLAVSPITRINSPKNHVFSVKQSKTNCCQNTVSHQPCQLANKPMNWKFDCPTIIQGTNDYFMTHYFPSMTSCGVNLVARISGGYQTNFSENLPTFDLVEQAIAQFEKIESSIIVVPPFQVLDASLEAIASGIKQLIIVTPDVPPLDTIKILQTAKNNQTLVLGPGSSGIIQPEKFCLGTLQPQYFQPGNIGIIGYSKTLIYEVAWALNQTQKGQSWAISLGQGKILGSDILSWLKMLNEDAKTDAIILIQPAQDIDFLTLDFVAKSISKPVIYYLFGSKTPGENILRYSQDILSTHLSNSIPATHSIKKIMSLIKKAGAIMAINSQEITQIISEITTENTTKLTKSKK